MMRKRWVAALSLWSGLLAACDCGGTLGAQCARSSDCPDGLVCVEGRCTAPPEAGPACSGDEDCPAGQRCVSGACFPAGRCPDGDADGDGVCASEDCDDTDPRQTGREVCDGEDNDCDGEVDEGVLSPCGNCDPECSREGLGGEGAPGWDLEGDPNDGVSVDADGALVLDSRRINANVIWIANTQARQVVKLDTTTCEELGRYWTDDDPSRTTVDTLGDVYVGNRAGRSVTKVSVLGRDCPDTNGDGVVTTSMGGGHILGSSPADRFMDDCVLWHTELPDGGVIRAMAAQEVEGLDGEVTRYVWVGGWDRVVWKLDAETGAVLLRTESPVPNYGFALDARGNLWISGIGGWLGRIDTTRCTDDASCSVPICEADSESDACDGAVKARIRIPGYGYGITVDLAQRVWLGSPVGHGAYRYDPMAPPGSRWARTSANVRCNGIAADAMGFVYAACESDNSILRINGDTLEWRRIPTGPNRGVAVDAEGKIWGINHAGGIPVANVLTPGPTIDDNPWRRCGPTLATPYTYSDMTGLQMRLAANPRGYYRHVFEACGDGMPLWQTLHFRVETPSGTDVRFRVRTADTREALESAEWVVVATVPPDSSPVSIADALAGAMIEPKRYLELEIQLRSTRTGGRMVATPRVFEVRVDHSCEPTGPG